MIKTRAKNGRHLSTPDTDKVKRCKGLSHSTSVHLFFTRLIVLSIAVGCGISHWMHVSQMHENHLTFSHLSSTERELTFRTEMGFYYSYFKQGFFDEEPSMYHLRRVKLRTHIIRFGSFFQMILASNLTEAWNSLLTDIRSEVPLCLNLSEPTDQSTQPSKRKQCRPLNAMQRFNLYPELILATIYRILRSVNLLQIQCYRVKRELNWNPIAIVVSPTQFAKAIQNDRYGSHSNLFSFRRGRQFIYVSFTDNCGGKRHIPFWPALDNISEMLGFFRSPLQIKSRDRILLPCQFDVNRSVYSLGIS
ncbi:hypothetical protein FGIG_12066 [Fasciola gigantica]|uniref:Uncharacterized protein n=1 Tax=Fasciola gigantica TaxID=46835 RepID=A0A504Y567_FASGI|nr:hypothetical protein FGIG_12066 [Fasciola gigantica]